MEVVFKAFGLEVVIWHKTFSGCAKGNEQTVCLFDIVDYRFRF